MSKSPRARCGRGVSITRVLWLMRLQTRIFIPRLGRIEMSELQHSSELDDQKTRSRDDVHIKLATVLHFRIS